MAIFLCCFPRALQAAPVSLVKWNFPLAAGDNTTADSGIFDNLTQKISALDTGSLNFLASGVVSAAKWTNGVSQKYWLIPFSSFGYEDITLSLKMGGSAFGPRDFIAQYRIGETGDWQSFPDNTLTLPNSTSVTSLALNNLPLPQSVSNQPSVFIRLLMATNTAINGGPVTVDGTNRLDDISLSGTALEDPEEEEPPEAICSGTKDSVTLSEILPAPKAGEEEYMELYNKSDECVDISNWFFRDKIRDVLDLPENTLIEGRSYLTFIRSLSLNNSGDTLALFDNEGIEHDSVTYATSLPNFSYSFNGNEWLFSSFQTPGAENIFDEVDDEEENAEAGNGIILNEILPNPAADETENEFIELYNVDSEDKNLKNWSLLDASKKIFTFEEDTPLSGNSYISIPRSDFGFSLNNTGTEFVSLLDPAGNTISQVEYSTTQENFSYSFDGKEWRWTKKITPGEENAFSKNPGIDITDGESGYVDIPLLFKMNIKNAKKPYKYSWDFGDGKRSALAEPKHTFEKTGTYKASVTLRSESGTTQKDFTVTIKKYPNHSVLITALHPNPEGPDTEKEWVEIKNFTQKKVDLTGWKIASGSDELINHPLAPDIFLQPNQTLRLTRRHAAFSLPNTSGSAELRYPNNESASNTQYEEQEVPEGSTCINVNGKCDFTDLPVTQKGKASQKEEAAQKTKMAEENVSTPDLVERGEPPAFPTKQEILKRMGKDFNLLMNQLFIESVLNK